MAEDGARRTWCPSGQPDAPEAVVLGVHAGESEDLSYLDAPVPAKDVIGLFPKDIDPTRVLRFAAHCDTSCLHRRGGDCALVARVVSLGPAATAGSALPRCHLRSRCQWFEQVGAEACRRCPFVTTATQANDESQLIADPNTTQEQLDAYLTRQRVSAQPAD